MSNNPNSNNASGIYENAGSLMRS